MPYNGAMNASEGNGAVHRGRPRDKMRECAILDAALELLGEVGYDRLTMDGVAARAHAGKGTLYRHWGSKAELVADALCAHPEHFPAPDTGSLEGDFEALLSAMGSGDGNEALLRSVSAGLATAASHDPQLAAILRRQIIEGRKGALRQVLLQAARRGEVAPSRDIELILEIIPAFIFSWAMIRPEALHAGLLRRILTELIYPLVVAPDSARWPKGPDGP